MGISVPHSGSTPAPGSGDSATLATFNRLVSSLTPEQQKAAMRYFSLATHNKGVLQFNTIIKAAEIIKGLEGNSLTLASTYLFTIANENPGQALDGLKEIKRTGHLPE